LCDIEGADEGEAREKRCVREDAEGEEVGEGECVELVDKGYTFGVAGRGIS
jgi:hypothetical protein